MGEPRLNDASVIKVNIDEEVRKMAAADGLTDARQLDVPVSMRQREYYAATIKSYYRGYDVGYAEGVLLLGRPIRRLMVRCFVAGVALALAGMLAFLRVRGLW